MLSRSVRTQAREGKCLQKIVNMAARLSSTKL
jgi:hypothetical protein